MAASSSGGPKLVNVEVGPARNEPFKRISRNIPSSDGGVRFPVQPSNIVAVNNEKAVPSKYVINRNEMVGKQSHLPSHLPSHMPSHMPQVILKNNEMAMSFNLPARWKRLLVNGDVVYVSPSGTTLRSLIQIKKYLLSSGTCKCGLPCPFKPDSLFDFNPKVATIQLPITNDSAKYCSHQIRPVKVARKITKGKFIFII